MTDKIKTLVAAVCCSLSALPALSATCVATDAWEAHMDNVGASLMVYGVADDFTTQIWADEHGNWVQTVSDDTGLTCVLMQGDNLITIGNGKVS